jgi:hypothetical protein
VSTPERAVDVDAVSGGRATSLRGLLRRRPFATRARLRGRRITDPVDRPVPESTRAVRGRLAAVSVRASIGAGAWVGIAIGLVVGAGLGAIFVWFAGAILEWQRDLSFTFGVARQLLPFGDQLGFLRAVESRWWLVIGVIALSVAAFAALVGALLGGVLAAAYNRSPRHSMVIVELPRDVLAVRAPAPRTASEHTPDATTNALEPRAEPNEPRSEPDATAAAPNEPRAEQNEPATAPNEPSADALEPTAGTANAGAPSEHC